jgi:hypothetical protein
LLCVLGVIACSSNHPGVLGGGGSVAPEAGGTGGTDDDAGGADVASGAGAAGGARAAGTAGGQAAGGQAAGGLNETDGAAGSGGVADAAALADRVTPPGTGGGTVDSGSGAPADSGSAAPPSTSTSAQRQLPRPLGETASGTGYLEYLPPGYGDGVKRPLLVVVPGISENGNGTTDLTKLAVRGPAMLIAQNRWPDSRPMVVLSMQHLADSECASGAEVFAFLSYALGRYQIDPQHVYLTGISCGAISAWNYIGSYHSMQIAAAVLIAGDGTAAWNTAGCALGAVAIWGFHAEGDTTIPITGTTYPIDHLAMCMPPGREAKKTIYTGSDHDSWTRTYDLSAGNDIYAWMLSQSR